MIKTDLSGEWILSGDNITTTTKIPGDFHSTLIEQKIIPEPILVLMKKRFCGLEKQIGQ